MVNLDWSKYDPDGTGSIEPGIHYVEIAEAKEKTSSKGDPMFELVLRQVSTNALVCWDYIMLGGKGANIGYAKLIGIGLEEGSSSVEPQDLIGRRVYASIMEEERVYEGKSRRSLKVDISDGGHCGYWPDGDPPLAYDASLDGQEETPF